MCRSPPPVGGSGRKDGVLTDRPNLDVPARATRPFQSPVFQLNRV
jgi:hypothetical protein